MQEVFYRLLKNFCGILFLPPDLRLCHELPYPFSLYKYTLLQPKIIPAFSPLFCYCYSRHISFFCPLHFIFCRESFSFSLPAETLSWYKTLSESFPMIKAMLSPPLLRIQPDFFCETLSQLVWLSFFLCVKISLNKLLPYRLLPAILFSVLRERFSQ